MALDARRRQKKAEKRNAKQKARQKELSRRKTEDLGMKLARCAAAPILHCCAMQELWDSGIGQVLVSRELASGQVAYASFLVDRYCLGVKGAMCGFLSKSEYFERLYDRLSRGFETVSLQPAAARKLVEGAVDYAQGIGLSPHSTYARARHIFGDIDPAESDRQFEFGKEGKPLFIAGPHDSPGRCASIVGILQQHCGSGGYDYIMHVPSGSLQEAELMNLAEAFDDDDEAVEGDLDNVIEGTAAESGPRISD